MRDRLPVVVGIWKEIRWVVVGAALPIGLIAAVLEILSGLSAYKVPLSLFAVSVAVLVSIIAALIRYLMRITADPKWLTRKDRVYALWSGKWSYSQSADGDAWDAVYDGRRKVTSLVDDLQSINFRLTRKEQSRLSFSGRNRPALEILQSNRSADGQVTASRPHKDSSTNFACRIRFVPPLRRSEHADVAFVVKLPNYKFAWREDVVETTQRAGEARQEDYNSVKIDYPTQRYVGEVFLPEELDAEARGIQIIRPDGTRDQDEERYLKENGGFSITRQRREGRVGWLMSLDVRQPPLGTAYRFLWLPPRRMVESGVGDQPTTDISKEE